MLVWFTKFYLSFSASLTADERRPWTIYENNGNEYLIIGAVVRSEYSNIVSADEGRPWTNYENNGNEYLITGAVVRSEYVNIPY